MNWHNSILHTHQQQMQDEEIVMDHGHDHEHAHHHEIDFWGWFKGMLGDLEHQDLGENHFEVFLRSGNQIVLDQQSILSQPVIFFTPQHLELSSPFIIQQAKRLNVEYSLTDPPFLEAQSNRGPPSFS